MEDPSSCSWCATDIGVHFVEKVTLAGIVRYCYCGTVSVGGPAFLLALSSLSCHCFLAEE